eukprot:15327286-Ditylum_brightwellii.AAC.2
MPWLMSLSVCILGLHLPIHTSKEKSARLHFHHTSTHTRLTIYWHPTFQHPLHIGAFANFDEETLFMGMNNNPLDSAYWNLIAWNPQCQENIVTY